MHVVVEAHPGARELEVEVVLRNPDATLADLLTTITGRVTPEQVYVCARKLPSSCSLLDAGLHEGARLGVGPPPAGPTYPYDLAVTGGMDAGRSLPLPSGVTTIGRASSSDVALAAPTMSREHFELRFDETGQVTLADLGSANGTRVDGEPVPPWTARKLATGSMIMAGAVALAVRGHSDEDRPRGLDVRRQVGPSGTVPFNRPPRTGRPAGPHPLQVPKEPGETSKPHFSIASVVGPLVLAAVMVVITADARFALFSALSPVLGIGTYLESRRSATRANKKARGTYAHELVELADRVREGAEVERARLRDEYPDPAEVLRRAALPSVRLWERRSSRVEGADFLHLHVGIADQPWKPPVAGGHGEPPRAVATILGSARLADAPVPVDLSDGGVVGVVGDRSAALAVARSLLCQAAVHHGPADLTIGVFVDPGREAAWDWAKWLPHTRSSDGSGGDRWLSSERLRSDALLGALHRGAGNGTVLVVLDSDVLTQGKNAPARTLLNAARAPRARATSDGEGLAVAGIVIAATEDRLPAACTTVVSLSGSEGDAVVRRPEERAEVPDVLAAGLSIATARQCARDLARFEDPELRVAGAGLPDSARLLPLLEMDRIDADSVRRRWRAGGADPGAATPLGVTEQGVFVLDLVRHGPHGLVGGTTGSGKSELLRSLVAGLAAHTDPGKLTFVLIDYKGGATFDACARLPHTVGMVTDLDEQLGSRALRALEAELHHRERLLRRAHADNLSRYLASGATEPLPRLVLVVDEFATMASDLSDFIPSLVGIAQRGRTLGVHMILATQRPGGVVTEDISANTSLRVALRVERDQDSTDVIGVSDAAKISKGRAGRACVRLGPGELVPIQTALVTCVTSETADSPVAVTPFVFGARQAEATDGVEDDRAPSDLARLVDAIVAANDAEEIPAPRRPWPEPLPRVVHLSQLDGGAAGSTAVVALADDPERQSQYAVGWDLLEGNLLLLGNPGSGTTTTLTSIALSLASQVPPGDLQLIALDLGAGDLAVLDGLPHTASVVLAGDRERQARLLRHLRGELDRRRTQQRAGEPLRRTVVLVDNFGALRAEFDDVEGLELLDGLYRAYADGPEVGLSFAVAADRAGALPGALTAVTTQKWLFRLADPYEYSSWGVSPKAAPHPVPGRAVVAATGQHVQVGIPADSAAAEVARIAALHPTQEQHRAPLIQVLPSDVPLASLGAVANVGGEPWRIPVGLRESDLGVAELVLYEGEHALVAGPARSGKSTALITLATALREAVDVRRVPVHLLGLGGRRSPLRECSALDHFAGVSDGSPLLAKARVLDGPVAVFIDDAEGFEDSDSAIAGLLAAGRHDLHVIAAGRPDALRTLYGHWTSTIRRSKAGLLLQPSIDLDGDLLGVTPPRRAPVQLIRGRGYLVQGSESELLQVAQL